MSTRALQFDILLLGFRDPDTDAPLAFGVVNFLSAGTSDKLTVWDTKEKTGAKTSVTLDVNGQAQVYGDGVYKLEVLAVDTSAVSYSPMDNIKIRAVSTNIVETNTTYTATTDDDLILCDTSGGAVLINLYPAADFISSLTIKNISGSSNDVTVDPDGSELVDGSATATIPDAASQQYLSNGSNWFGAGVSTGTNYTSTSLVSGTGNTFDVASGITTINTTYPTASTTVAGIVELSTLGEDLTGTSDALATTPVGQAAINPIIQHSVTTESTGASTSVIIPFDDTIPQITEGAEIFSVSFTPKLATSKVVVSVDSILSNAGNNNVTIALFKDVGVDAICARGNENGASSQPLAIKHSLSPGATTAITFSVRFGGSDGTSTHIGATGAYYGAAATTTIEIIEIR